MQDDLRDEGSPVDLAKSYMLSRPPWASPSSFKFGFRTPPSAGSLYFNDKNPTTNHLLASSKVHKGSVVIAPWNKRMSSAFFTVVGVIFNMIVIICSVVD